MRDYEVVKVEQDVTNELLLVIDEGEDVEDEKPESSSGSTKPRATGAYYKGIERKMLLKRRRVNVSMVSVPPSFVADDTRQAYEPTAQKWDVIKVQHVRMDDEEENERADLLAEVIDPNYMFAKADVDAEGEVDTEELVQTHPEGSPNGIDPNEVIDPVDVFGE